MLPPALWNAEFADKDIGQTSSPKAAASTIAARGNAFMAASLVRSPKLKGKGELGLYRLGWPLKRHSSMPCRYKNIEAGSKLRDGRSGRGGRPSDLQSLFFKGVNPLPQEQTPERDQCRISR